MSSSSTCCSASESTSFRVDTRCWGSTTRQASPARARTLVLPAHCVQILEDMDEAGHGLDESGGRAAQVVVVRVHPVAGRAVLATDQRVEAAVEPHEEHGQLTLLR